MGGTTRRVIFVAQALVIGCAATGGVPAQPPVSPVATAVLAPTTTTAPSPSAVERASFPPPPTPSPIPTPTIRPGPTPVVLRWVTFDLGPGVGEADVEPAAIGLSRAHAFLRDRVGAAPEHPIVARVRADSGENTNDGSGEIRISLRPSSPSWTVADWVWNVSAHEYTHTWQGRSKCLFSTPTWFREGMADYVSLTTLVEAELLSDAAIIAHGGRREALLDTSVSLADLEPCVSCVPPSRRNAIYQLGYYAVRLLVDRSGIGSLGRFCATIARTVPDPISQNEIRPYWQTSFRQVFGIELDQFYAIFDEARPRFATTR